MIMAMIMMGTMIMAMTTLMPTLILMVGSWLGGKERQSSSWQGLNVAWSQPAWLVACLACLAGCKRPQSQPSWHFDIIHTSFASWWLWSYLMILLFRRTIWALQCELDWRRHSIACKSFQWLSVFPGTLKCILDCGSDFPLSCGQQIQCFTIVSFKTWV